MLEYSLVRASIRGWILRCTPAGVQEVIYRNPSAPRPPRPFVTLQVTTFAGIGQPFYGEDLINDITQPIYDDVRIMVGLQAYGDGAQQIVLNTRQNMQKTTNLHVLRAGGMALIRDMGIHDLTSEGTEQRAGMDIEFRALDEILDDVGCIEKVEVDGLAKVDVGVVERIVQFTVEG